MSSTPATQPSHDQPLLPFDLSDEMQAIEARHAQDVELMRAMEASEAMDQEIADFHAEAEAAWEEQLLLDFY